MADLRAGTPPSSKGAPAPGDAVAALPDGPVSVTLRKCKIVREGNEGSAVEYIFDQNSVSIGSMEDNDVILEDESVSRYHARIFLEQEDYFVQDLSSTNGTWVNGVRVREAFLKSGCTVRVGHSNLRFSALDERVEIQPSAREAMGDIVGKSIRMREIFTIVEKIAPTAATVILEGETGTGKEVVARTFHRFSARASQPFIVVDCGAVPENLIESELFGHEKGSFTGALASRQGLFEMAHGGTLFLDEIGELALDLQPKLLRALEQREIRRVGSNRPIKIDVRVIAATNRNLQDEVKAGRFREDLYYRLSVVRIQLPPLRERREDTPLLVRHLLKNGLFNRGADGVSRVKGVSREVLDALMAYEWPGNVRELVNVIERACSFAEGEFLLIEDLPEHVSGLGPVHRRGTQEAPTADVLRRPAADLRIDRSFKEAKEAWVANFERDYLGALLAKHHGNLSQAAREADIDRKHFRRLVRKYGLVPTPSTGEDSEPDDDVEDAP